MTKQKRDIVFTLRLTKDEYIQLCVEAENEKKKPSQLARERILNKEEK